jgi:hypothetical protein
LIPAANTSQAFRLSGFPAFPLSRFPAFRLSLSLFLFPRYLWAAIGSIRSALAAPRALNCRQQLLFYAVHQGCPHSPPTALAKLLLSDQQQDCLLCQDYWPFFSVYFKKPFLVA